jgi:hypothetical protein
VKFVTIKFGIPEGGSRKVNTFLQKTIDEVGNEILLEDTKPPYKFPLFNKGAKIGVVEIEEVDDSISLSQDPASEPSKA